MLWIAHFASECDVVRLENMTFLSLGHRDVEDNLLRIRGFVAVRASFEKL